MKKKYKIIRAFTVDLTESQSEQIEDEWKKDGQFGWAMLAQPRMRANGYCLRVAIVNEAMSDAIANIVLAADKKEKRNM